MFNSGILYEWLRGKDLNFRPPGYGPDELPDCSTPRNLLFIKNGGERGIRTLARLAPTIGFQDRPLQPLGYFSIGGLYRTRTCNRSVMGR